MFRRLDDQGLVSHIISLTCWLLRRSLLCFLLWRARRTARTVTRTSLLLWRALLRRLLWRALLYWLLQRALLRWLLRRYQLCRLLGRPPLRWLLRRALLRWLLWRRLLRRLLRRALLCLLLRRALLRRFLRRAGHRLCDGAVQSAAHLGIVTNQTPDERPVRAEHQGIGDASGRHATEELIDRMRGEDDLVIHSKSFHEILDRLLVLRRVFEVHPDDYQPVLAILLV